MISTTRLFGCAAVLCTLMGPGSLVLAQSSPSSFTTVYNIGTVAPGSTFAVPTAVTGTSAGDGDLVLGNAGLISPASLLGDVLGSDSQLNLFRDGTIESAFSFGPALGGTNVEVNLIGGTVGTFSAAQAGTTVNLSGGSILGFFRANGGSTVNISAGDAGTTLFADTGSTINFSGGAIGDGLVANPSSTINVIGTEFFLNGVKLTNLPPGQPRVIRARNAGSVLSGTLADGSFFDFDLNTNLVFGQDRFAQDATLTVTLIPTPSAALTCVLLGALSSPRRR